MRNSPQKVSLEARETFEARLLQRIKTCPGVVRVTVLYDSETLPSEAWVEVDLDEDGLELEVRGAVARLSTEFAFELRCSETRAKKILFDRDFKPNGAQRIWAVGRTREAAIENLARARNWGPIDSTDLRVNTSEDGSEFTWSAEFSAGGTFFKCAGREDGGTAPEMIVYTITWWK